MLDDERSRQAIALALRLADNPADDEVRRRAYVAANAVGQPSWDIDLYHCAAFTLYDDAGIRHWAAHVDHLGALQDEAVCGALALSRSDAVRLVRHFFGNPFREQSTPAAWPAVVVELANALYDGQDCGFAMHDLLYEVGQPELAEHFRQEEWHPKGCWVVDLVLGKE